MKKGIHYLQRNKAKDGSKYLVSASRNVFKGMKEKLLNLEFSTQYFENTFQKPNEVKTFSDIQHY